MDIRKSDLSRAAQSGLLPQENVEPLWRYLTEQRGETAPRFDFTHVAYYFGALVVIIAMAWYLRLSWDRSAGWTISLIALVYALIFGGAGVFLRRSKGEWTLGGLLIVVAVCMTPIFVYGIQRQMGLWVEVFPGEPALTLRSLVPEYPPDQFVFNDLMLQAATAICAFAVLLRVRFPFLLVPGLVALWLMAVEPRFLSWVGEERWDIRWVSAMVSIPTIAIGLGLDRRRLTSYSFWLHLLGGAALWGAVTWREGSSEWVWLGVALVNLVLIWFGVVIHRRIYAVYGAAGAFVYMVHLSNSLFKDSLWYPFVLTAFGIAVILVGLWYNRKHAAIDQALRAATPAFIRRLLRD